ncbi:hypothetical protein [Halovivax gelatinilyticus]|uniref:hypothetical protein n=1 Tax=Halovivax gelatinilyticus TaxID=2961597 RepID=UPI0020CA5D4C|nr:hypothetical protein [Halovivax gelatinilyticus]
MQRTVSRRRLLALAAISGVVGVAGCTGGDDGSDSGADGESDSGDGGSADGDDESDASDDTGGLSLDEPSETELVERESSPDDPLSPGEPATFGSRELLVHDILVDDDAVSAHVDAADGNEPPDDGAMYVLVDLEVRVPGAEFPVEDLGLSVAVVTDGATYDPAGDAACYGEETAQLGTTDDHEHHRETRCLAVPDGTNESGVLRVVSTEDDAEHFFSLPVDRSL